MAPADAAPSGEAPADNADPILARRLADYCRTRLAAAGKVRITGLRRIFGGHIDGAQPPSLMNRSQHLPRIKPRQREHASRMQGRGLRHGLTAQRRQFDGLIGR